MGELWVVGGWLGVGCFARRREGSEGKKAGRKKGKGLVHSAGAAWHPTGRRVRSGYSAVERVICGAVWKARPAKAMVLASAPSDRVRVSR